jgi:hypothetical protein
VWRGASWCARASCCSRAACLRRALYAVSSRCGARGDADSNRRSVPGVRLASRRCALACCAGSATRGRRFSSTWRDSGSPGFR